MKLLKTLAVVGTLSLIAFSASAEDLVIGSGSEGGTYHPVVQQMIKFCAPATDVNMSEYMVDGKLVGGSLNNVNNLLDNKIQAGLIQADVAYLKKQTVPAMERVQGLLGFYREDVHVIVPATVMTKAATSGFLGIGGSKAQFGPNPANYITDLHGATIGAWGGSLTTAKVIDQLLGLRANIVDTGNEQGAVTALSQGKVNAILATVGYPADWIKALPKSQYKLLNVSKNSEDSLKHVYGTSGVSYDNMVNGGQVNVLNVQAILFTRVYHTPAMINALAALQKCVTSSLYKIQDTPDTHPAWQEIKSPADMLNITWDNNFKAPDATAATAAAGN